MDLVVLIIVVVLVVVVVGVVVVVVVEITASTLVRFIQDKSLHKGRSFLTRKTSHQYYEVYRPWFNVLDLLISRSDLYVTHWPGGTRFPNVTALAEEPSAGDKILILRVGTVATLRRVVLV